MHDPSRDWKRVSPLLDELLDLDAAGRAARLAVLRASDPKLAAAVEELLAQEDALDAERFL